MALLFPRGGPNRGEPIYIYIYIYVCVCLSQHMDMHQTFRFTPRGMHPAAVLSSKDLRQLDEAAAREAEERTPGKWQRNHL